MNRLIRWITVKKLADLTGYSQKAIYTKVERGIWQKGLHWRKAPDGRLFFDIDAIEQWIEGMAA